MQLDLDLHHFSSIILAGDRSKADSLIDHSGVSCKALIDIDGVPMVRHVIDALQEAKVVHSIVLSGPEESEVATDALLAEMVRDKTIGWLPPGASPSASAFEAMHTLDVDEPVLLTTADHPLLTPEMVDAFGRQSLTGDVDVTVGLAPYALVQEAYPDMKKTVLRFSDGEFCGCNLFAFLTPEGRRAASFWRKIEQERKKPRVVIGLLGWWVVLRYKLGLLPLEEALAKLSKRLGLRLRVVILPYANAAVDVDSIADYALVQGSFAKAAAEDN